MYIGEKTHKRRKIYHLRLKIAKMFLGWTFFKLISEKKLIKYSKKHKFRLKIAKIFFMRTFFKCISEKKIIIKDAKNAQV